jgi:hypothetical protein
MQFHNRSFGSQKRKAILLENCLSNFILSDLPADIKLINEVPVFFNILCFKVIE